MFFILTDKDHVGPSSNRDVENMACTDQAKSNQIRQAKQAMQAGRDPYCFIFAI